MRNYLLHYGYAQTLQAFDSAAGVSPDVDSQPSSSRQAARSSHNLHFQKRAHVERPVWRIVRSLPIIHLKLSTVERCTAKLLLGDLMPLLGCL